MTLEPKVVCFMPVEARNASMSASSASFSVMQPFIFGHTQNFKRIFQGAHRLPSKQVMCGLESLSSSSASFQTSPPFRRSLVLRLLRLAGQPREFIRRQALGCPQ